MNRNKIRRTVSAMMGTAMAALMATGGMVAPAFAEEAAQVSLDGATGTVYDLGGLSLPICQPGEVELTYMGNDTWCAGVSYNDGLPVQEEIEKRTGVHINWDTYSSDVETVLQTRLASMEGLPDMVEIPPFDSNVGVDTYSSNGVLIPLNDLIEQYAPNIQKLFKKYPALKAMCTSSDGNIYGLAGWWGDINDYVPDYLYIRQDWLDNIGLEMPKTVDELYNVMKAFKEQDANGNGDPNDEIPVATKNGLKQLYYLMTGFGYDTNSLWYTDADGEVHYAAVEDNYKEMLTFLNKCYSEGLISDDLDGTQLTQNITEDKVGIVCHDPADNMASSDDLALTTNPNCNYQFMPVIQKDENGTAQMTKRSLTWHYYGITSACENPEAAIKWIDYIVIPIAILFMFSVVFTVAYYSMSKSRILTFEEDTADNVNNQMKEVMDNLLKSASQYSMTPWVKRLKYMQKMPELMKKSITASDISDYASSLALTEINDGIIESICIYYSTGDFGITSIGKVDWKGYTDIYQIESANQDFMNGDILKQNNQHVLCHDVTMTKNAKKIQGFFLIQTIPLENSYSGEVNVLFFIPYENFYDYITKFADEGIKQVCLTDASNVLYTEPERNGRSILEKDAYVGTYGREDQNLYYQKQLKVYISVYTKAGMDFGIIQIVDNQFLLRDFWAFFRWILFGDLLLSVLIFLVSLQQTKRSYQPIEHIVQLLDARGETAANTDEYEMIERALKDLESQKKKLEVSVYEQNPMIEQYILYGLLNERKMDEREERYINMVRQYANFRVMVLNDGPETKSYIDEIDEQLAIYPQIHTAFLRKDKGYLWVLNYGEENLLIEIVELLTQVFNDLHWREAVLGVGAVHENIRELAKAYQEAEQAIKYHFFFGEEHVIIYDREEICHRGEMEACFVVTQEEKKQMEDAISDLDAGGLLKVYTAVLRRNSVNPFMRDDEWRNGVVHLNEWLFAAFKGYGELPELTEMIDPVKYSTFEAYMSIFASRLENRIERSRNKENPAYAVKNEKIRKYVEEHLTDANLSLNETARIMHYTATYFGKYFKEQFGCAFQEYVAVRRVECAKECLNRDPYGKKKSIQEIALQCGFTNDVTFRRTFKRYTGMTPSQFCKDGEA